MPTFQKTEFDDPINEVAMPLIATRNRVDPYVSGTAFVIGPGLALTAFHVIEDYFVRLQGAPQSTPVADMSFEILTYLSLGESGEPLPMKIMRAWRLGPLDLAVLALGTPPELSADHVWKCPPLELLPPRPGTQIAAFGFANGRVEAGKEPHDYSIDLQLRTCAGEVLEVHHSERDSARLCFPCFRTNTRFDGGMSGGPVFNNETGAVCGVICSSMPPADDDDDHLSYASTLWPVVGTMIEDPRYPIGATPRFPLIEKFRDGTIIGRQLSHVGVTSQANGLARPEARYNRADWDSRPPI